jgi:hypothetical protein
MSLVAVMMVPVSDDTAAVEIPAEDPRAVELVLAVHGGDTDAIRRLLAEDPQLARAGLVDRKGGLRTLLHLVADWPGYFPNGPQIVHLLIEAGADPSFRHPTRCDETALHWAASSDDVDVAAALIDCADINASPDYAHGQTALEVAGDADTMRQALVDWLKERAAAQA